MSEETAAQTPLLDLLRAVPRDARAEYEHDPCHHSMIPYGRLCHEAAVEIERLRRAAPAGAGCGCFLINPLECPCYDPQERHSARCANCGHYEPCHARPASPADETREEPVPRRSPGERP